jgi:putative ABC transport system ATP-binding protein
VNAISSNVIEVRELSREFRLEGGASVRALVNVSFDVREGEFVAIEGPSGGGKSTLLAVLGLLDRPTSGEYRLAGTSTGSLDHQQQSRLRNQAIGFVFQSFNLIGHLSALENVLIPLEYSRRIPKSEHMARASALLDRVGLGARMDHLPHQLSGGQQQRVAIARALVTSPAVLLADEPTGNLDSKYSGEVMALLKSLHDEGSTIMMVTHNTNIAACADRRLTLRDGTLVAA